MKAAQATLAMLAIALPIQARAATAAEAPTAVRAVAESAPAIMIPVHTAVRMKQELDDHALFVDVDSASASNGSLRVDALVPLHAFDAPENFNAAFLEQVDQALRAKRLRWSDGVVLVSHSAFTAMQAAELLREHGYTLVFAVTSP